MLKIWLIKNQKEEDLDQKTKSLAESPNNESSPKTSEKEASSEANLDASRDAEASDLSQQAKSVADSNSDEKDTGVLNTEKNDSDQKPDEK